MNSAQEKHERKICPRCKSEFVCKVGDVANCQCSVVLLMDDERTYIEEHYSDCLCCACMKAMKSEYSVSRLEARMKVLLRMAK